MPHIKDEILDNSIFPMKHAECEPASMDNRAWRDRPEALARRMQFEKYLPLAAARMSYISCLESQWAAENFHRKAQYRYECSSLKVWIESSAVLTTNRHARGRIGAQPFRHE